MSDVPKKNPVTHTAAAVAEKPTANGAQTATDSIKVIRFNAIPKEAVKIESAAPAIPLLAALTDGSLFTVPLAGLQSETRKNRKGADVKDWFVLTTDGTRYRTVERTARTIAKALEWARENGHDAVSFAVKHDAKKHLILE